MLAPVLTAMLVAAAPEAATDTLETDTGVLADTGLPDYELLLRRFLLTDRARECAMTWMPSRTPEAVSYLWFDPKAKVPKVVLVRPKSPVWAALQEAQQRRKAERDGGRDADWAFTLHVLDDVRVETVRLEAGVSASTAEALRKLWTAVLSAATPPRPAQLGLDGERFHFAHLHAAVVPLAARTGTFSASAGSRVNAFVALAQRMALLPALKPHERAAVEKQLAADALTELKRWQ